MPTGGVVVGGVRETGEENSASFLVAQGASYGSFLATARDETRVGLDVVADDKLFVEAPLIRAVPHAHYG